jgi:hypothetical protein
VELETEVRRDIVPEQTFGVIETVLETPCLMFLSEEDPSFCGPLDQSPNHCGNRFQEQVPKRHVLSTVEHDVQLDCCKYGRQTSP